MIPPLHEESGVDISEFKKITGLKDAKIAQIKAAIERGRRFLCFVRNDIKIGLFKTIIVEYVESDGG